MAGKVMGNGISQNEVYQAVLQALLANTNTGGGGGGGGSIPQITTRLTSGSYTVPIGYYAEVTLVSRGYISSSASYGSVASYSNVIKQSSANPCIFKSGDIISFDSSGASFGEGTSYRAGASGVREISLINAYARLFQNGGVVRQDGYCGSGNLFMYGNNSSSYLSYTVYLNLDVSVQIVLYAI